MLVIAKLTKKSNHPIASADDIFPWTGEDRVVACSTEADINQDWQVDLLDVTPFVELLAGG